MLNIPLNASLRKFVQNPLNQWNLICCGEQYLRVIQINPINRIFSEAKNSLVSMSIEKKNFFVDMQFKPKSLILVVITKINNIYIFNNLILAYEIESLGLSSNIAENNEQANEIKNFRKFQQDALNDENEISMYEDRLLNKAIKFSQLHCGNLEMQMVSQLNTNRQYFKCLCVTTKGFYVGWKGGLISCYELSNIN